MKQWLETREVLDFVTRVSGTGKRAALATVAVALTWCLPIENVAPEGKAGRAWGGGGARGSTSSRGGA